MPERANAGPAEAARAASGARPVGGGTQQSAELTSGSDIDAAVRAGQGVATLQAGAAGTGPPSSFRMTPAGVIALQRAVGNRAVSDAMRAIQRVPVKSASGETLYNQSAPGDQAGAKHYGGKTKTYDMTRDGDSGVTVTVKIRFVRETRNTLPPTPPATKPDVGDLVPPETVLPPGDQAWATATAAVAVAQWNGRLTLVGEETNVFSANTKKRLPVTFKSVPLFGLKDEADTTVTVQPPGVVGGSTGNPIDAGNYYMKKDDKVYPAADNVIYAHEYGHLLGIPDEYSQSNEQMNLLLHKAAPKTATSSMAMLDKKTIERMALAALSRPMNAQLNATMSLITDAIRGQRKGVKAAMAKAAREAARTTDVVEQLKKQLEAQSEAAVNPKIPGVVAFETTKNFSNRDIASQGVEAGFTPAALTKVIGDAYWKALLTPQDEKVAVPDFGDVKINMQTSVYDTTDPGTALAAQGNAYAASAVGATGPGLPAMPPAATLTAQLAAVPATWKGAGAALETSITPATFIAKMVAALSAAAAAEAAPPPPGAAPAPKLASSRALYNKAYALVTNSARTASQQLATDLVSGTLTPVLTASVTALQATIAAEVNRLLTTPPGALAAAPPDPNMAAIVAGMKTRLDAAKTALAGTGQDPLGVSGATTPAQDVTYSYQGLMGSSKTTTMRADQFQGVVDNFNSNLKTFWEKKFTAEVK